MNITFAVAGSIDLKSFKPCEGTSCGSFAFTIGFLRWAKEPTDREMNKNRNRYFFIIY